ncbi:hypothetical protein P0O24_06070 [Methanotrichaceae archaeon M04Ac]|jgi:hypothetical protein|uniref:Uncharacterized protein n=1 Tax=Candidatus Methanocrinis alkalitolerans TaxID=3033395 RepID=A0ABT5XEK2_9EURY|nr:hypothetical protein [Candidatus Methanocrinis alkalitolerans]MDF0593146.1 hypothetical protein [Candidatus Methanocrinis alkalitolerans]
MCETYNPFQVQVDNKVLSNFEPLTPASCLNLSIKNTTGSRLNLAEYVIPQPIFEISSLVKSRIYMSDEIEEFLKQDKYFDYIMNNIFDMIDNILATKYPYRIYINYKTIDEIIGWKQVHILVELYNVEFDTVLVLWETVSNEIEKFFKRLMISSKDIWPTNKAEQLFDLINLEFNSSD